MKILKIIWVVVIISSIAVLTGCASTTQRAFIPIAETEAKNTLVSDIYICINKCGFYRNFKHSSNISNITMGGLIPALIDAAIYNAVDPVTQKNIDSIKYASEDIYFGKLIKPEVERELSDIKWLKITDTKLLQLESSLKYEDLLKSVKSPNALILNTEYNFTPDFKVLVIKCNLVLFPTANNPKHAATTTDPADLANFDNCLYKNSYIYRAYLNKDTISQEEAGQIWIADNAKLIKTALKEGSIEISKLIKKSFQNPTRRTMTVVNKVIDG